MHGITVAGGLLIFALAVILVHIVVYTVVNRVCEMKEKTQYLAFMAAVIGKVVNNMTPEEATTFFQNMRGVM